MMIRSFLPVGQGAFYLEQFDVSHDSRINIVYDCGSLTSKRIVEEEIRSNLSEGEEVLLAFISHFDADHVNGLEFLLKYCKVKNIVFPLIPKPDRYLLSLKYLCDSNNHDMSDFTFRMINDPYKTVMILSDNTRIFQIRTFENDYQNESIYDEPRSNSVTTLESGKNILDSISDKHVKYEKFYMDWEYVPFNFRFMDTSKIFLEALRKSLSEIKDLHHEVRVETITEMWCYKSVQKAVKNAYKEIKGDFNTNSMTLFSGIRTQNIRQTFATPYKLIKWHINYCCLDKCTCHVSKPNGCLYTGDYDAKKHWDELSNAYKEYWNYIGCIQVPHHGSNKNYNKNIAMFDAFFIISAGSNNIYRHPSGLVIRDLIFNRKYPFIVTEQKEKEVFFEILF